MLIISVKFLGFVYFIYLPTVFLPAIYVYLDDKTKINDNSYVPTFISTPSTGAKDDTHTHTHTHTHIHIKSPR